VAFPGEDTADQALNKPQALQKEHLIDLEDACVVVRDRNGKNHVKQAVNLTGVEAATGGLWGAWRGSLVALLFLNPLLGFVTGAAMGAGAGALAGALSGYGIAGSHYGDGGRLSPTVADREPQDWPWPGVWVGVRE